MHTDIATRSRYAQGAGIHRIVPEGVARPEDADALHAAIRWARAQGVRVTPRGAGSSMGGGAVGPGLVLDLTGLPARIAIDSARRVVHASASVSLGAIAREAMHHGLRLGPDPSSSAWATVGGAISTNAAGPRSHRLGAMDRWVESLVLVTSEGDLALARDQTDDAAHPVVQRFARNVAPLLARHRDAITARWPSTRKNSFGYGLDRWWRSDRLIDLVIGAEGTLGVVTEATLRLEPMPAHKGGLQVALRERPALPEAIAILDASNPVAIELLDRSFLALVGRDDPAVGALLLVEFESADAEELDRRRGTAARALTELGHAVHEPRDPVEHEALWAVRHEASPALARLRDGRRSLQVIEDGCVPVEHLPGYLDAIDAACRRVGVDAVMFGHAGDGHVHVNLLPDLSTADWQERVARILDAVTDAVVALGGTPSGEHGVGRLRAPLVEQVLGAEAMDAFRAIRAAFDPDGLWHQGVILPDGHAPLDRLKVGPDAAPLPDGVDELLRTIEEQRRWGRDTRRET